MRNFLRSRFALVAILAVSAFGVPHSAFSTETDLSITAANVAMSADGQNHKLIRTAGASITPGQPVFLNSVTDGKEYPADANGTAPAYEVEGIAVTAATAGQPVVVCYQDNAFVIGAAVVIGDTLWLGATPGGITKTAADNVSGMYVAVLGVANSTTTMNFRILRAEAVKP